MANLLCFVVVNVFEVLSSVNGVKERLVVLDKGLETELVNFSPVSVWVSQEWDT